MLDTRERLLLPKNSAQDASKPSPNAYAVVDFALVVSADTLVQ